MTGYEETMVKEKLRMIVDESVTTIALIGPTLVAVLAVGYGLHWLFS